jgi:hypothetical protein
VHNWSLSENGKAAFNQYAGIYFEKYMELVESLARLSNSMMSVLINQVKEYETKHF